MMTLSDYLRAHSITQADFAQRVGLTQAQVSKICRRKSGVSLETAGAIERATDGRVPVSVWLSNRERPS